MNALAVVATNNYAVYTPVLLYSLQVHGRVSDLPMFVLTNGLDEGNEKVLRQLWKDIRFWNVDTKRYNDNHKYWPHFWSFETFNPGLFGEFDKVLYLDSDIVDLPGRAINALLDEPLPSGIGMVWEQCRQQYNAGCILSGPAMRTEEQYDRMIKHQKRSETFGRDQATYNELYQHSIKRLDFNWNTLISEVVSLEDAIAKKVSLLHYIYKPHMADERIPGDACRYWKDTEKAMKDSVEGGKCVYQ